MSSNVENLSKEAEKYLQPFRLDFRDIQREGKAAVEYSASSITSCKKTLDFSESEKSVVDPTKETPKPSSFLVNPKDKEEIEQESNIKWLESILPDSEVHVSENLSRFLSACSQDPKPSIQIRFKMLQSSSLNEYQQQKVQKFYYRLLEAMLVEEEIRLQKKDFGTLLHHDIFHRSLLSCCFEIVSFVYNEQKCLFPSSIKLFNVPPFEVSKLIDNVIRYEKIPENVKQHLVFIDHKILLSYLWLEDSPVYNLLQRGGKDQEQYLYQRLTERYHQKLYSYKTACASPVAAPLLSPRITAKSSATSSNSITIVSPSRKSNMAPQLYSPARAPGTVFKSVSLEIIFRKLFDLAFQRTSVLLQKANLHNVLEYAMQTLIHIITQKYSILLQNRNLDQIIICSIYGVARAMKLDITFKFILQFYKQLPQAEENVWKSILIRENVRKDIIEFYNEIYIVKMEPFLLQLNPRPSQIPITNSNSSISILQSPVKVTSTPGSPLSNSSKKRSRNFTFNVGKSPVKDLKQYNDHENSFNNHKRITRRLFEEEEPEDANRPIKKQKLSNEPDNIPQLSEAITSLTNNKSVASPSILRMPK